MELPGATYLYNLSILTITFSAISVLRTLVRHNLSPSGPRENGPIKLPRPEFSMPTGSSMTRRVTCIEWQ
jgi:hypothetical protein